VPVNCVVRDRLGGAAREARERLTTEAAKAGQRYRLARRTVPDAVWRPAKATAWMAGRRHRLIVAINETTAEVKYFVTNAAREPLAQVLAVAFRRCAVGHPFRLGKQETALMHYEGRDYTGLMRHLILGWWCLSSWRRTPSRCGAKNTQVTAEQVCRALNQRCAMVFPRRRAVREVQHTSEIIRYHQRRTKQAAPSHKKRRHRCVI
jgi:hypothetical protein